MGNTQDVIKPTTAAEAQRGARRRPGVGPAVLAIELMVTPRGRRSIGPLATLSYRAQDGQLTIGVPAKLR